MSRRVQQAIENTILALVLVPQIVWWAVAGLGYGLKTNGGRDDVN